MKKIFWMVVAALVSFAAYVTFFKPDMIVLGLGSKNEIQQSTVKDCALGHDKFGGCLPYSAPVEPDQTSITPIMMQGK